MQPAIRRALLCLVLTASIPVLVAAVIDALRPLGVTHLDMPLTPSKLWHAIQDARRTQH
jgi:carbon-monoxide dehydrogenase large subunit